MKLSFSFLVFVLLCSVEAGIIFNGIRKAVQDVRCGFHKLGDKLIRHQHPGEICATQEEFRQEVVPGNSLDVYDPVEESQEAVAIVGPSTFGTTSTTQGVPPTPSSDGPQAGRNNFKVNCKYGYKADAAGICRQLVS